MHPLEELINRKGPSEWEQFLWAPVLSIARWLYRSKSRLAAVPIVDAVSVVCISDTHNSQPRVPNGEILIHAGDLTQSGTFDELQKALAWINSLPHEHKVVIAGNHDIFLDVKQTAEADAHRSSESQLQWGDIIYLNDELANLTCSNGRRLSVYGSPKTPVNGSWPFQYPRKIDVWAGTIPFNVDILVTHGPPRAHLDLFKHGCSHLLRELWRVRPKLHVFGHVHAGYGTERLEFDGLQRAFERTVIDGGGFLNLLWVVKESFTALLARASEAKCQLVNAAAVGGLRDDERRAPIVVEL